MNDDDSAIVASEVETQLFDDVAFYRALREELVPRLRSWPSIRVWHAGIGSGEEVYATSIVLREEGLWQRSTIWATDPSAERVERAELGAFASHGFAERALGYRESGGRSALEEYTSLVGEGLSMRERLRERVVFFQHDPSQDASFAEFQLIVYRPRVDSLAKRARALGVVHDSLSRFGILVLQDGTRIEQHPHGTRYEALLPGRWAFRRVA